MNEIKLNSLLKKILSFFPVILLFISILNESNFNDLGSKYFSFNFSYILIFYFSLKKNKSLGYGLIFIAGLFNDVVIGIPIGISSLLYLLICGAAAYIRNLTLRPSLIKDWIFFLITIMIINSLSYIILVFIFEYEINYFNLSVNMLFTFLFYFIFSYLFGFLGKILIGRSND